MRLLLLFALTAGTAASAAAAPPRAAAVFAGGCFWCTESDFDKIPGVVSTTSGYIGGTTVDPTYKQVSAGGTGHIEAVRIEYDPTKVSYSALLQRFFRTVDPLDAGGQFCDRGYQYRSAVFTSNASENAAAVAAKNHAAASLKKPVATLILPAKKFYPAEAYHQDYYKKNPVQYRFYRLTCGRDARIKKVWSGS